MMRRRQPSSPPVRREPTGTGIWWGFIAALFGTAAIVALVLQNRQQVSFEWLWFDVHASLAGLLLTTALVSVATASAVGLWWRHRRRRHLAAAAQEPHAPTESEHRGPMPTSGEVRRGPQRTS